MLRFIPPKVRIDPMKWFLLVTSVAVTLSCVSLACAHPPIVAAAVASVEPAPPHWVRIRVRHYLVAKRETRIFDRRKLGMLCVMPPDMQVALDWPGPACAYTDNFIFLPHRHHRMR